MRLETADRSTVDSQLNFEVADVELPVMSVASMIDKDYDLVFSKRRGCTVSLGNVTVPLVRRGNKFMMRGQLLMTEDSRQSKVMCPVGADVIPDDTPLQALLPGGEDILQEESEAFQRMLEPWDQVEEEAQYNQQIEEFVGDLELDADPTADHVPEAPDPVSPAVPDMPDAETVRQHNLTHIPFQPWCQVCVQGQGKDRAHCKAVDADE